MWTPRIVGILFFLCMMPCMAHQHVKDEIIRLLLRAKKKADVLEHNAHDLFSCTPLPVHERMEECMPPSEMLIDESAGDQVQSDMFTVTQESDAAALDATYSFVDDSAEIENLPEAENLVNASSAPLDEMQKVLLEAYQATKEQIEKVKTLEISYEQSRQNYTWEALPTYTQVCAAHRTFQHLAQAIMKEAASVEHTLTFTWEITRDHIPSIESNDAIWGVIDDLFIFIEDDIVRSHADLAKKMTHFREAMHKLTNAPNQDYIPLALRSFALAADIITSSQEAMCTEFRGIKDCLIKTKEELITKMRADFEAMEQSFAYLVGEIGERCHKCQKYLDVQMHDAIADFELLLDENFFAIAGQLEQFHQELLEQAQIRMQSLDTFNEDMLNAVVIQLSDLLVDQNQFKNSAKKSISSMSTQLASGIVNIFSDINAAQLISQEELIGSIKSFESSAVQAVDKKEIDLAAALDKNEAEVAADLQSAQCRFIAAVERGTSDINTAIKLSLADLLEDVGDVCACLEELCRKLMARHNCLMSQQHGVIREDISRVRLNIGQGINRRLRFLMEAANDSIAYVFSAEGRIEAVNRAGAGSALALAALVVKAGILILREIGGFGP